MACGEGEGWAFPEWTLTLRVPETEVATRQMDPDTFKCYKFVSCTCGRGFRLYFVSLNPTAHNL